MRSHLAKSSGWVKMAPNIQETDLENFREEDDEDLKVFHKTKKATKMVWLHTYIPTSRIL